MPIGSPSPIAGYGGDTGDEIFAPSDTLISFELLDAFDDNANALSLFGFYRAGTPGSETIIFGFDDVAGSVASIDFLAGTVSDLGTFGSPQSPVVESMFTVGDEPIGFFFAFNPDVAGGANVAVAYSETALNGMDLVGTYQSTTDPTKWLISLEYNGVTYGVEATQGIQILDPSSPIPEPSGALLFMAGIVTVAKRIRYRG
ncbi:MAG: hypothetical protein OEY15_14710 [Myxococcales bacterium]|nr:hypothetical protein [Myxococcales bacterium]